MALPHAEAPTGIFAGLVPLADALRRLVAPPLSTSPTVPDPRKRSHGSNRAGSKSTPTTNAFKRYRCKLERTARKRQRRLGVR